VRHYRVDSGALHDRYGVLMKPNKIILIYRFRHRKNGWRVELKGEASVFASGHTRAIAIASLIEMYPHVFKIEIQEDDPK
jgi:hypothetical protein